MTSEEKVFHDAVWQRAPLDLQKHKGVLDATIRFYLNEWEFMKVTQVSQDLVDHLSNALHDSPLGGSRLL